MISLAMLWLLAAQAAAPPEADATIVVVGHTCAPVDTACAAERLDRAAKAALDAARRQPTRPNVPQAGDPDPALGVANVTASSQRLGIDLRSATALPPRPGAAAPAAPFARRP